MVSVYLIKASLNDDIVYKIGWTKRHPMDRIREMKTGNAHDLDIVHIFKSEWGTKIESALKRKFKEYSLQGEWFCLKNDDVFNFIDYCKNIENNFIFLKDNNTWFSEKYKNLN